MNGMRWLAVAVLAVLAALPVTAREPGRQGRAASQVAGLGLLVESGPVAFEDVTFLGGVFPVWPGETKELALLNLQPGVYTLLCFFPGPDGAPHAANGMVAQFEIVAPAS